jgi:succinyl-diaminopimelate desuccinylase
VQPLMTERDAPVVTAIARGIRTFWPRPDYVISPGTYDQKHIARIGHIYDCIAYGPGILDLAHRPDEWVGIATRSTRRGHGNRPRPLLRGAR